MSTSRCCGCTSRRRWDCAPTTSGTDVVETNPPLVPLLLGQAVFTAVAALLILYLLSARGRTVREGREYAIFESPSLVNRTLPYLRQGLNRETAEKTAEVIHEYLQPAAVAIAGGRTILTHVGAGTEH